METVMKTFEGIEFTITGLGFTKSASILSTKKYNKDDIKELALELIDEFMQDIETLIGGVS